MSWTHVLGWGLLLVLNVHMYVCMFEICSNNTTLAACFMLKVGHVYQKGNNSNVSIFFIKNDIKGYPYFGFKSKVK